MSKLDIEAGRIRLRRILAGYRYFSAHAKAILHQVRLPSAVNYRAVRFATEGVFPHTKEFLVTYVVKLLPRSEPSVSRWGFSRVTSRKQSNFCSRSDSVSGLSAFFYACALFRSDLRRAQRVSPCTISEST
jgi:hypothetical protein